MIVFLSWSHFAQRNNVVAFNWDLHCTCTILDNAVQWSTLLLICWCQFFCWLCLLHAVVKALLLPALSPCGWVLISICQTLHWGSQCDGVWWLPFTGLSWLPASVLACNSINLSRQFPHSHLLLMGLNLKWTDLFKIVVYNKHSTCTAHCIESLSFMYMANGKWYIQVENFSK